MTGAVFLIGSQRSGTTWLQCLLGAHPAVAAPQEPEFFTLYIAPWHRAWTNELRSISDEASSSRLKGVSSVMTNEQFVAMVRGAVDALHAAVLELKPGASMVLEKCPEYHRTVDLIRSYVPDARFIHLVRDGRDVANSLVAAAHGWGRRWAPPDVGAAAAMWATAVRNARVAEASTSYLELRYEDFLADAASMLEKALAFCGVDSTREQVEAICEQFSFDALRRDPSRPYDALVVGGELTERLGDAMQFPDGFFRQGRKGGWRETWGDFERTAFDREAGDLLVELGYEPDRSWAASNHGRARARLARARLALSTASSRVVRAARAARRELARGGRTP